jgi:hypothetical protein
MRSCVGAEKRSDRCSGRQGQKLAKLTALEWLRKGLWGL